MANLRAEAFGFLSCAYMLTLRAQQHKSIEQITPKSSVACYAVRFSNQFTMLNFDSIIKYGITFWGNSSNSGKIFTLQKKVITIMPSAKPETSSRRIFKQLQILLVPCQWKLLLINLLIHNQESFQTNSSIHNINTINLHHRHRPNANLSCFQKSTFHASIKIFNSLPHCLTIL